MSQQIAVITGGSRDLGQAAALHLGATGVGVVLTFFTNSDAAE